MRGLTPSSSSRLRVDCLQRGSSGLMYACQQGDLPGVVRILGEEPVSAYRQDRNRRTALHYCRGSAVAGQLVTAAPGLLDSPDRDGLTPLHLAVIQGDTSLVSLLIAQRADVDALDNERHSVVHWATVCSELECLRLLLAAGANPSAPDILGGCPLHYAAQLCGAPLQSGAQPGLALRILRELLNAKGTSVHVFDHEGRTPLLWAAAAGSPEAVIALVKAGAHIEAADRDGLTALHCAASRGHTGCIETLTTLCGSAVDIIDCNGCTALHYAATLGHADATALLLDLDAVPDRQDRKGRTPAHCACAKGQLETVKILANHKANLWIRNIKGDLPLHEAVASGRRELVLYLLQQKNGYINASGHDGKTLLHIAASHDHADICKILLDQGAAVNPLHRTTRDILVTPLDCALQRGNKSTAKYLQMQGGVPAVKLNTEENNQNQVKLQSITPTTEVKQTRSSVLRSGGRLSKTEDNRKQKKDSGSENKSKNKSGTVTTFQEVKINPGALSTRTKSLTKVHCSSSSDDSDVEEFCTCIHRCHHGKRLYLLQSPRRLTRREIKELSKNSHSDSDIHARSHSRCDKRQQRGNKRSSTSMSERQRSSSRAARQLKSARSKINKRSESKEENSSDYKERRKSSRDRSHSRSKRSRSKKRIPTSTEDSDDSVSSEELSSDKGRKFKSSSHSSTKSKTSNKVKSYSRRVLHSYSEDEISEEDKPTKRISKSVASSPKSQRKEKRYEGRSPRHISEERIVKRKTLKTETTTKRTITPNAESISDSDSEEEDVEEIEGAIENIETIKQNKKKNKKITDKYTRSVSDDDKEEISKEKSKTKSKIVKKLNEKEKSKKNKREKSLEREQSDAEENKVTQKKQKDLQISKNQDAKRKKSITSKEKRKDDIDESLDKSRSKSKEKKKLTDESTKTTTSTISEKKVKETKIKQDEHMSGSEFTETKIDTNKPSFTTSESENENRPKSSKIITEAEIHKAKDIDSEGIETKADAKNIEIKTEDENLQNTANKKNAEDSVSTELSPSNQEINDEQGKDDVEQSQMNQEINDEQVKDDLEQSQMNLINAEQSDKHDSVVEQQKSETTEQVLEQAQQSSGIGEQVSEIVQNVSKNIGQIVSDVVPLMTQTDQDKIHEVKQEAEGTAEKSSDVVKSVIDENKEVKSKIVSTDTDKKSEKLKRNEHISLEDRLIGERINHPIAEESFVGSFEATPALHMIEMVPPPERFIQMEYKQKDDKQKESFYTSEDDTTDSSEDSEKFETNQTPRTAMDDLRFSASDKFDGQSITFANTESSIVDSTAPPSVANTWSSIGSPSRKKKLKKRTKNRVRTLSEEVSERGYESSGMMDSGFEPSPRIITRSKSGGPKSVTKTWKPTDKKIARLGRAKDRKPGDKNAVNMTTVNQSMQANIRRYYTERIIFQHLLDLKRLQIRSSRAHEAVLVKRAIDQYHRSNPQVARYTDKEFTYEAFERHLYDTLKKLQKVGSSNYKTIAESFIENECKSNPLFCTTKTFRCNHATHAYTGIPCAAYIPLMNHHTIPKPGFPKVPEPSFLPRIKTAEKRDKNAVALELSHGNDKQLITLPSDKLDVNKKYYVTFSVRGSNPVSEAEGKSSPKIKSTK